MVLLGTKTSFCFVKCISDWPQYSLTINDLTGIFCKKCFPTLFNISKTIVAVRKVREVFVEGPLKNIKLLHFFKIYLGFITIVSAKQWLKHEISTKMFLLVVFFIFSPFCSFNYFTFTLDKLKCWWNDFHFFLPFYYLCIYFYCLPLTAL